MTANPTIKHWFKFWNHEWLDGSIRFTCTSAERGIFIDLIVLASTSTRPGFIQLPGNKASSLKWLATRLNIRHSSLIKALAKLEKQERIMMAEDGIYVVNYLHYQEVRGKSRNRSIPPPSPMKTYPVFLGKARGYD
jgi:hypothetical protein